MQYLKEKRFSQDFSDRLKRYIGVDFVLLFLTLLFFLYFVYLLFFGEKNIFRLIQKERYRANLQSQITELKEENKALEEKIHYLKNDRFFIEKKAREDLGLVKEGEEIYIIVDRKSRKPKKEQRWIDKVIQKYQEFRLR
ncbi:cell division protein FtsB [Persephonella hydrogeniphila]|uniref:Cell division protein FtsB n=1 Tax=Persephonella hydrogeniphila TaxID=198703 RepID=A0A285N3H8_9AQUI|nr:septum formation initiator family protein [Persephonella hydrogeniphila]SNZ03493.1 cell division protein FtsB [Persephonella hydrogeniphila]